jgi:hypothetical protein
MSSLLSALQHYRCIILCGESSEAVSLFGRYLQSSLPQYEVVLGETFGNSLVDFNAVFKSLGRHIGRKIICASSMSHVLHRILQPSSTIIWVKSDIKGHAQLWAETHEEAEKLRLLYGAAGIPVPNTSSASNAQSIRTHAWNHQKALLMIPFVEVFFLSNLGKIHVLEASQGTTLF